jgi:hypothetical protein
MPVEQYSLTYIRVLLVLMDCGILAHSKLASLMGGFVLCWEDPWAGPCLTFYRYCTIWHGCHTVPRTVLHLCVLLLYTPTAL